MKNKIIKILLALAVIVMIFSFSPLPIQAFTDPTTNPGAWKPDIDDSTSTEFKPMIESVLGYINVIGIVISVVVLVIIGIKYLLGSIEEKAEYKKTMTGYLIGALLVFLTTTVANILYQIGTSI